MKPDFALDFRGNQITLRHRSEGGWAAIGAVAMDDPDLDAAMGYLRATALGLSPRGIASKLILPNDAILYTSLPGLPMDREKRAARIAEGLVGRTPYDVADLVYDWTDAGDTAHLAVIARETLAEAEGFANQHRFNPVSFAALPDQGGYDGEVWFGPTQLSETLLARGEVVERDEAIPMAPPPAAAQEAGLGANDFEMGAEAGDATDSAALDEAALAALADASPPELPTDEPILDDADFQLGGDGPAPDLATATLDPDAALSSDMPMEPAPPLQEDPREIWQDFVADAEPAAEEAAPLTKADDRPPISPVQPDLFAAPAPSATASFAEVMDDVAQNDDHADEAPMAVDVPLLDEPLPDSATPHAPDLGEPPVRKAEGLIAAFSARRAAALAKAEAATNAAPRIEPALAKPAPEGASAGVTEAAPDDPPLAPLPAEQPAPAPPRLGAATETGGAAPAVAPVVAPSVAPVVASGLRPPPVKHVPAKKLPQKPQNLAAMPGAKAKGGMALGWILTIVLLLSLVAAAALSSYLLEAFNRHFLPANAVASAPALPEADLATTEDTRAQARAQARAQDSAPVAPAAPAQTAAIGAVPLMAAPTSAPLLPIASAPAPQSAPVPSSLALPAVTLLSPPAPRPAPAVAAQSAVPVTQGKPALVPTPRPDFILAAARSLPDSQNIPVFADPALAAARPAPRSAAVLAAAAAAAPVEDIAAPPVTTLSAPVFADPALANARPLTRPDSILQAGRVARLASAPASLVASAAINAAENALLAPPPDPSLSALALAVSPVPPARPRGLQAAYEASRAAAAEAQAQAQAAAAEAQPAPEARAETNDIAALEAEAEEEVTRAAGGATRSVVEKQATQRNALNLSNVNLVGIFGSSANRYALIRNPSGSFKKLKVGDRFDGGRIAAITESEVRYDKGGELLALRMPRG